MASSHLNLSTVTSVAGIIIKNSRKLSDTWVKRFSESSEGSIMSIPVWSHAHHVPCGFLFATASESMTLEQILTAILFNHQTWKKNTKSDYWFLKRHPKQLGHSHRNAVIHCFQPYLWSVLFIDRQKSCHYPVVSDLTEISHTRNIKGQSLTAPPINQPLLQPAFIWPDITPSLCWDLRDQ